MTLEDAVKNSGKTVTHLCRRMGKSRPYVYKKIKNPEECTASEIKFFCEELRLTTSERDNIFLLSE